MIHVRWSDGVHRLRRWESRKQCLRKSKKQCGKQDAMFTARAPVVFMTSSTTCLLQCIDAIYIVYCTYRWWWWWGKGQDTIVFSPVSWSSKTCVRVSGQARTS
ncbi:uncharacterized protein Tco025E_00083 [Trypanosoma conorhini]|uniref:Uncharacterized protein n=1 Tax=Trypanosoma conorhini TaxID=83891 RepID=A0A422QCN0_9TRYP|nr:uncharacterized protein Tco025E_00083 [Trypanosoma conorhini]RNF27699.1 hypothetical protein Tco025E_00083 [Trypanosoma conorhini]